MLEWAQGIKVCCGAIKREVDFAADFIVLLCTYIWSQWAYVGVHMCQHSFLMSLSLSVLSLSGQGSLIRLYLSRDRGCYKLPCDTAPSWFEYQASWLVWLLCGRKEAMDIRSYSHHSHLDLQAETDRKRSKALRLLERGGLKGERQNSSHMCYGRFRVSLASFLQPLFEAHVVYSCRLCRSFWEGEHYFHKLFFFTLPSRFCVNQLVFAYTFHLPSLPVSY